MINEKELEKFTSTYSLDRIKSFIYSSNDTIEDITQRYHNNVKISQALYPELTTLEIILRNFQKYLDNTIYQILKKKIKKMFSLQYVVENCS